MPEPKNKNRKVVRESTIHAYSGKGRTQEELRAAEKELDEMSAASNKRILEESSEGEESSADIANRRLEALKKREGSDLYEEYLNFKHGGSIKGWPPVGSRKKK